MPISISDQLREQIEELIDSAEEQLEAIRSGLNEEDCEAAHRAVAEVVELAAKVGVLIPRKTAG